MTAVNAEDQGFRIRMSGIEKGRFRKPGHFSQPPKNSHISAVSTDGSSPGSKVILSG
jgi:hypothetical protein